MAFIIETPNPFEPLTDVRKHVHPGGISVRGWLELTYPGFKEFATPTICIVNGKPLLRKDWNQEIRSKDIINFIGVTGDPVTIIILVVAVVLAVVLALVIGTPDTPGATPASDPVYSTKGQTNAIRLGEPIEVNYGRNRIYPSLAARPFFRYVNNDQFQHSLFCIGQGQYEIHAIQIGDTLIDEFEEVTYQIVPPGSQPTLFSSNVITSAEAGGQTLFGTNEPEYLPDGWVGPFSANPPGTEAERIEVDITFPGGLFRTTSEGKVRSVTVGIDIQVRPIDSGGSPLGPFASIITESITMASTTPQRLTFGADVTPARYEVRARRTTERNMSSRYHSETIWEGLRAFIDLESGQIIDYGDVTLLAVKIRATSNLNARTQERFNVICTRKLPIRISDSSGAESDDDGWTDPQATRSIVWAFVDVFRSLYGGRITNDNFFDWDVLEELDALYESRDEHFDWTFRDPITVWDAAKAIARVGRAVPLLVGSLITMKRDGPLEIPVAMFTPDNIVKGTFQWDIKLWEPNDFDSISVEYTEVETGYKQEQVLCILPGGTGDNPEDMRLAGVQDRNHAYHEGLYILASKRYLRENFSFETGMEGFLPSYGDLIAISHDVPRWGQSGYILAVEEESGGWFLLFVSEPLEFSESNDYQVMLRNKRGELVGPVDAVQTDDPKQIRIHLTEDIDWLTGGTTEPMLFLFGVAGQITQYGRVVKIEPQGGERIRITAVNESSTIHSFDELEAPPLAFPSLPPEVPDLPVISELFLEQVDDTNIIVQATWLAAFGAQYYIVQTSEDGINWGFRATTTRTSIQLPARVGEYWVRVAAVNNGQGPWISDSIMMGLIFGLDDYIPWEYLEWGVTWWEGLNIARYLIKVYDNSDPLLPVLKRTVEQTELTYLYDYAMAVADGNLVRDMLVTVDAMVFDEDEGEVLANGNPRSLALHNNIPLPPGSDIGYEFDSVNTDFDELTFRFFWNNPTEEDLITVKVWVSDTPGFDPNVVSPLFTYTAGSPGWAGLPEEAYIDIPFDGVTFPTHYWRVGLFDVWGNEISTNLTDEDEVELPWLLAGGEWNDLGWWDDTESWED